MTNRPMLGSLVNYITLITVTTDSETSVHRGKDRNLLFVKVSPEVHIIIPMLPSEETMLMTARIF